MQHILILLSIFIIPTSFVYATPDLNTTKKTLQEVGILLNHQQFKKATEVFLELQKSSDTITIIRDIDYENFLIYIQQLGWEGSSNKKLSIITGRLQYHPEERNYASLLTRQKGTVYSEKCIAKTPYFIDKLDKAMCQLYTNAIPNRLKKILVKKTIAELTSYVMNTTPANPQNISDLGNLIGHFMNVFPKENIKKYSEDLVYGGMYLMNQDKYWTNAYIMILHGLYVADPNEVPNEIIEDFKKNYIGDEERWTTNVQPWIDAFYKK